MTKLTTATLVLFIVSFVLMLLDVERQERRGDYPSTANPLLMMVTTMFFFMFALSIIIGVG